MKKLVTLTAMVVLAAMLVLTACTSGAPPAAESTPAPTEAPAATQEPQPTEAPAPTEDTTPAPTEAPTEPEESTADATEALSVTGKMTYDDMVAEFGEPAGRLEVNVDGIATLGCSYRNTTMWFRDVDGTWILDGVVLWRPSAPYTISGVKVAMPTDEAVQLLEADGYEYVDGETMDATNEVFSLYQKTDPDGKIISVQLVDSPEDNMVMQIAVFYDRDAYQIPEGALDPIGEDE